MSHDSNKMPRSIQSTRPHENQYVSLGQFSSAEPDVNKTANKKYPIMPGTCPSLFSKENTFFWRVMGRNHIVKKCPEKYQITSNLNAGGSRLCYREILVLHFKGSSRRWEKIVIIGKNCIKYVNCQCTPGLETRTFGSAVRVDRSSDWPKELLYCMAQNYPCTDG